MTVEALIGELQKLDVAEQKRVLSFLLSQAETSPFLQAELSTQGYVRMEDFFSLNIKQEAPQTSDPKGKGKTRSMTITKVFDNDKKKKDKLDSRLESLKDILIAFAKDGEVEELLSFQNNDTLGDRTELSNLYHKFGQTCLLIFAFYRALPLIQSKIEESRTLLQTFLDKGFAMVAKPAPNSPSLGSPSGAASSSTALPFDSDFHTNVSVNDQNTSFSYYESETPLLRREQPTPQKAQPAKPLSSASSSSLSTSPPAVSTPPPKVAPITLTNSAPPASPAGPTSPPPSSASAAAFLPPPPSAKSSAAASSTAATGTLIDFSSPAIAPPLFSAFDSLSPAHTAPSPAQPLPAANSAEFADFADFSPDQDSPPPFQEDGTYLPSYTLLFPKSGGEFGDEKGEKDFAEFANFDNRVQEAGGYAGFAASGELPTFDEDREIHYGKEGGKIVVDAHLKASSTNMHKSAAVALERHRVFVNQCAQLLDILPVDSKIQPLAEEQVTNLLALSKATRKFVQGVNLQTRPSLKKRMEVAFGASSKVLLKMPWSKEGGAPSPSKETRERSMTTKARLQNRSSVPSFNSFNDAPSIKSLHEMSSYYTPVIVLESQNAHFPSLTFDLRKKLTIGRKGEDSTAPDLPYYATYRTRVVSRIHAEIWFVSGNVYIRDLKSSSGTFLNAMRLSEQGKEGRPFRITTGDVIQFGVDIKGTSKSSEKGVTVMVVLRKVPNPLKTLCIQTIRKNWKSYDEDKLKKLPLSLQEEVMQSIP